MADDRISTAIRVAPDLLERLDKECDQRVVSRNLIINKAIEHYLSILPPLELPDA